MPSSHPAFRLGRRVLPWLILAAGLLLNYSSPGQEGDPPPAAPPAAPKAEKEPALKEQTIYIPYAKLRAMFEKEGRGVFVPYEKFQELWKAAQAAAKRVEDVKPPVGAIITEIDSVAEATKETKDVVKVKAKLSIDILTDGWHEVPLRLADSAIRSAKIGGQPARVIYVPDQGYKLLYEKKGKEPQRIELVLEYSKAFRKTPGMNCVEFDAPQAPVNRWQIRIDQPGVKVQVHPNLSTTEGGEMKKPDDAPAAEAPKETTIEAFVGSAAQVKIDWNPKAEGAAGEKALATVQVRQEVRIEEGAMRTRALLAYEISRADVEQLEVQVPAEQTVVNVFDANVRKWEVKKEGPLQTITIQLFQPTRGSQNIVLELENVSKEMMALDAGRKDYIAPVIDVRGVGRQQGVIVARLGAALRGEVAAHNGLLQIDANELPPPLAGQDWPFAYRYAALPFTLTLSVEKIRPQIEVDQLVELFLEPEKTQLDLLAVYNIQKAGLFQLELDVPEGYEVRQVLGRDAAGAVAVAVDSFHVDEITVGDKKQKTRLVVNLARKALGKVALLVELERRDSDENLRSPTGKSSALAFTLPRVAPDKVARSTGRFVFYTLKGVRVTPVEATGLRAISVAEALQGIDSAHGQKTTPDLQAILAYAFTQETAALKISAERRKPFITAQQLLTAKVESGVVKYDMTLAYNVEFSGVKSLRLDVPANLYPDHLHLQLGAVKDRRLEPQPKDVAAGMVTLELAGDGDFLGARQFKFTGDAKLDGLEINSGVKIVLPALVPQGVDRAWGRIAIAKSETIDIGVEGTPTGVRPIDPQQDLLRDFAGITLPEGIAPSQAFEFHGPWSLTLLATRYELESVKRTSIDRAFVRMVVTRGNETSVQALYRVRSAKQRIAIELPEGIKKESVFDRQPLRVNDQAVTPEKDPSDTTGRRFFIPIAGKTADEFVLIEFRYTLPGNQSHLELPSFPDDPAIQQVYLAAYLPEERKLLGVLGGWTEEDSVEFGFPPEYQPARQYDAMLLAQVREGVAGLNNATDNFPTSGVRRLYSAIRPEAGSPGSLRLIAWHRYTLWTIIVLVVGGVGVVLAWRPLCDRLWWLAALIVAVVLSAVFAPTFAAAVLDSVFWTALALVLVVWFIQFVAWVAPLATRPLRGATAAAAVAAAASTASAAAPPPIPTPSPPSAENSTASSPFASEPKTDAAGDKQEGGPSHE